MADECNHAKPKVVHPLCEITTLRGLDNNRAITVKAKTPKKVFKLYKQVNEYMKGQR